MLCTFEVGDLLDSVKFPGSKSRRGSCTLLDAARQKVQEVHGGMCCVSFLQRDPSINLRFKLEKLFYKKIVAATHCRHTEQTIWYLP